MKKMTGIASIVLSSCLHAGTVGEIPTTSPYFVSVGAGYAWSRDAGVRNPDPAFWDPSVNGYDENLGSMGFYSLAAGRSVHPYVDLSFSFLKHLEGNYQKHQFSPVADTPGFTGQSRTRFFKLDNTAYLVNASLHPAESMFETVGISVMPFVGAGIGLGHNVVKDFHTVSLVPTTGNSVGSTTSIGNNNSRTGFAWQANAGLNLRPANGPFSFDVGYRYFDGGRFETARTVLINTGTPTGFSTASRGLSGHLKTNELVFGINWHA